MQVENGRIVSVETNRGTIYPKLVINCAGVFSDEVARMAGDRFFSIHPRRGTNSILDKKTGKRFSAIASVVGASTPGKTHTKGGGILHTVHDNLLVGPDAVETYERENTATNPDSIERVFAKQKITMPELSERDIITYFTGVRAPTYEEDFIIEWGRKTKNIYHVAGIQSPGLTTAPVPNTIGELAELFLTSVSGTPKYSAIIFVTNGEQKPPWQRPMPGRRRFLMPSTVGTQIGEFRASSISPRLTSSQRQMMMP